MSKRLAAASLAAALLTPQLSQADTIFGIYAGAFAWQSELSGDVNLKGNPALEVESLGIDDDTNNSVFIAVEHFVPFVPNVKLAQTALEFSAEGNIVDFSHTDATLYYELLDNWVSLDLGLTARIFDGEVDLPASNTQELSGTVPLLYAKAQFDLPFTGLSFGVEGNFLGIDGNNLRDLDARLNYEIAAGFGIALGYRTFGLELDALDDIDADVTADGAYLGATFHF